MIKLSAWELQFQRYLPLYQNRTINSRAGPITALRWIPHLVYDSTAPHAAINLLRRTNG